MPPPNMRSIFAKVHQTSKSVVSRRNFSSSAAGDGKDPKKSSAVNYMVTRTLGISAVGYTMALFYGRYLSLEGGGS